MQAVLDLILIASRCIVGWLSQFDTFLESCLPRQESLSLDGHIRTTAGQKTRRLAV